MRRSEVFWNRWYESPRLSDKCLRREAAIAISDRYHFPAHGVGHAATTTVAARLFLHLPNALTVSRILLIPVFVVFFLDPTPGRSLWAAGVFGLAALTDAVDGYLARRWGQVTSLGKLLDPIADKLLVLTALFLLVDFELVEAWVAIVLAGRELFVTGLRGVAAREGIILSAESTGKLKMAAQVVAILFLILDGALATTFDFYLWGTGILFVSVALSVFSAAQYCRQFVSLVLPRLGNRS